MEIRGGENVNLEKWQDENGYRSNYVAKKLGITGATWSRIKKGVQSPSVAVMDNFATHFGDTEGAEDIYELFRKR